MILMQLKEIKQFILSIAHLLLDRAINFLHHNSSDVHGLDYAAIAIVLSAHIGNSDRKEQPPVI